jgi:hypothetical protein
MAAGIQCFDASGNLLVDVTSRLARIVGSAPVTANGSVLVPTAGDLFYAFQPFAIWGFTNMNVLRPNFSVSGATLSWTYSASAGPQPFTITGLVFFGIS